LVTLGIGGVYLPLITPLTADGAVDAPGLQSLAHHYLDAGLAGLVALGTTGEPATLAPEERRLVVEACAEACTERGAQLIVGPGTNNTSTTIVDVRSLAEVKGVTAALCVVPYYTRPSQAGVMAHFEAVADASPVPLLLYNIPYRTGLALESETILALAKHPNIVGVKQSVPLDRGALRVLAEAPSDFAVLCGEDPYLFPATILGGAGAIAASAHFCTARVVEMIDAALAGNVGAGLARHEALLPVVESCFAEPSPTVIKGVLHARGLIASPAVRLPLLPATPVAVAASLTAIDQAESVLSH
jgi:4-hydroxy-tetrahydrodipicolinate synthase